jgi:hypothetical protein
MTRGVIGTSRVALTDQRYAPSYGESGYGGGTCWVVGWLQRVARVVSRRARRPTDRDSSILVRLQRFIFSFSSGQSVRFYEKHKLHLGQGKCPEIVHITFWTI